MKINFQVQTEKERENLKASTEEIWKQYFVQDGVN